MQEIQEQDKKLSEEIQIRDKSEYRQKQREEMQNRDKGRVRKMKGHVQMIVRPDTCINYYCSDRIGQQGVLHSHLFKTSRFGAEICTCIHHGYVSHLLSKSNCNYYSECIIRKGCPTIRTNTY